MKYVSSLLVLLLAGSGMAQEIPKNAPHFVKTLKAPGVEVKFLDFGWNPEAFATLEKGGEHPVGKRPWALARIYLPYNILRFEGNVIPVGVTLVILHPSRGGSAPTFELRKIDMRDVFPDLNVIGEPPEGDTIGTVPAVFEKADTTADRLDVRLTDNKATLEIAIHYGDRRAKVVVAR